MRDTIFQQLQRLGIRNQSPPSGESRQDLEESRSFRQELWRKDSYDELVSFVRESISSELSRKLEHIINPPKAVGLAEDVSLNSLKWFLEYWWKRHDDKSPDLAVASDNTVVAYWHEPHLYIKIRFLSSGLSVLTVKHQQKDRRFKDRTLPIPVRELPVRFD